MNKLLIISYADYFDKQHGIVMLDEKASNVVYDDLRKLFAKEMKNEDFWLEDYDTLYKEHNSLSLDDLPNDIFMQAYDIIMIASRKYDELKPYAQELQQKLEADPRFKT